MRVLGVYFPTLPKVDPMRKYASAYEKLQQRGNQSREVSGKSPHPSNVPQKLECHREFMTFSMSYAKHILCLCGLCSVTTSEVAQLSVKGNEPVCNGLLMRLHTGSQGAAEYIHRRRKNRDRPNVSMARPGWMAPVFPTDQVAICGAPINF